MASPQMSIQVKKSLSALLAGKSQSEIQDALKTTMFITIRHYQDQMPVNKGDARKSVRTTTDEPLSYAVGATAKAQGGFPYPTAVATGTNKWKDSPFDFGKARGGQMRQSKYTPEEVLMFMAIQKRTHGKGISMPPNQFDVRAAKAAEKEVVDKFIDVIIKRNA